MAECARLGFTQEAITYSNNVDELGPRGTLSNEGRILRWCEVLTSDARYDVGEANRDNYFRPEVWLPAAEQAHLRYAKSLNERAALASWGDCPTRPSPCNADINRSGRTEVTDLLAVLAEMK